MSTVPESLPRPITVALPAAWLTPLELLALGAIWGASFLFQRVASEPFGVFALVEMRLALGALVLLPFLWAARSKIKGTLWLKLAVVGALNSAIPFMLFAWGAARAPAAIGAIANSLTVMFAAIVAFALYGERIGGRRLVGLVAGFAGVVVLVGSKTSGAGAPAAAIAGTVAALLYGISGNLVRKYVADVPPMAIAGATLVWSSLLVAPFAIANWPTHAIAAPAWGSAIALGLICTGFAYALYFRLIQRIGAARAATVTYLVPLFGITWAWLILGEPLTASIAIAGALILGGVALSQQKPAR